MRIHQPGNDRSAGDDDSGCAGRNLDSVWRSEGFHAAILDEKGGGCRGSSVAVDDPRAEERLHFGCGACGEGDYQQECGPDVGHILLTLAYFVATGLLDGCRIGFVLPNWSWGGWDGSE